MTAPVNDLRITVELCIRVGEGILVGEPTLGTGEATRELRVWGGDGGKDVLNATSIDRTGEADCLTV